MQSRMLSIYTDMKQRNILKKYDLNQYYFIDLAKTINALLIFWA